MEPAAEAGLKIWDRKFPDWAGLRPYPEFEWEFPKFPAEFGPLLKGWKLLR